MIRTRLMPLFCATLALILSATITGCRTTDLSTRPVIVASVPPLADLVRRIGGENWSVVSLVPPGKSPADYEPTMQEQQTLEDARCLFLLGVPAEHAFLDSLSSQNDRYIVDLAKEADRIEPGIRITPDQIDPHLWLSPRRMRIVVQTVEQTLTEADPDGAAAYAERAENLDRALQALDASMRERFSEQPGSHILMYHPALSYLAEDYGLTLHAIQRHGKESNAQAVHDAIELGRTLGLDTVFYQREFPREEALAVAEEANLEAVPLSLLEPDYFGMMQTLTDELARALEEVFDE